MSQGPAGTQSTRLGEGTGRFGPPLARTSTSDSSRKQDCNTGGWKLRLVHRAAKRSSQPDGPTRGPADSILT
eukprot:1413259-Pyramimonas_sp.AAC.1